MEIKDHSKPNAKVADFYEALVHTIQSQCAWKKTIKILFCSETPDNKNKLQNIVVKKHEMQHPRKLKGIKKY